MRSFHAKRILTAAAIEAALAVCAYLVAAPFADRILTHFELTGGHPPTAVLYGILAILAPCLLITLFLGFAQCKSTAMRQQWRNAILDSFDQAVVVVDSGDRYMALNDRAGEILGTSRREIGQRAAKQLLDQMRKEPGPGARLAENGVQTIMELNGRHYQLSDKTIPGFEGGGQARCLVLADITEHMELEKILDEIAKSMEFLESATGKISNSSLALSQGATQQASSIAEITASMGVIGKKTQSNAETSAKGRQFAAQAKEAAERSGGEITNALAAMAGVQDAGGRIAKIVKLIDDIAFQTNLLALNAAVEAARAGRQGKGFAVVADEVRNLAGRSAKAARDTALMVEDVTQKIGDASAIIAKLEIVLGNIVQDAMHLADVAADSANASSEQAAGIFQVNQGLNQMDTVTQETMTAAEQTTTSVATLSQLVSKLRTMMTDMTRNSYLSRQMEFIREEKKKESLRRLSAAGGSGSSVGMAPASRSQFQPKDDSGPFPFQRFQAEDGGQPVERRADPWNAPAGGEAGSLLWPDMPGYVPPDSWEKKPFSKPQASREGNSPEDTVVLPEKTRQFLSGEESRGVNKIITPVQKIILDDAEFGRY